jgi:hypothetical protein
MAALQQYFGQRPAMQQNDLFVTMVLLISAMLHCNIQMFEQQSPQN